MDTRKLLVFGRMPADATPETRLPAGPWCFAGQEALFPDWETAFEFPPEPLQHSDDAEKTLREAQALALDALPRISARLNQERGLELPPAFWETALIPSLLISAQILAERNRRIQSLIRCWGTRPLLVPLLSEDCEFSFESDYELTKQGFFGYTYNHWIFSRLLLPRLPAAWEHVLLPRVRKDALSPPPTWKTRLRAALRKLAYAPPFPHIKGFSLYQSLRFSSALLQNRNEEDYSVSAAEVGCRYALPPASSAELPFDPLPFFWSALPRVLVRASLPRRIAAAARKRVFIASIAAVQDTEYRLRLARLCAAGHKPVYIQHGGNYGMLRHAATTPFEEYNQHAFLTWGWRAQSPESGNFLPLPHAQTSALRDAHRGDANTLLFVGNSMELFPHRLDSRPNPTQVTEYRRYKGRFLAALPEEARKMTLYRPYFDVPAALEDWPWVKARFPELSRCTDSLDKALLACRLLVLDHHGTTLNLAFAAGVPMLLFWNPRAWELCPEAETLLDMLYDAGIWRPTPEEAAAEFAHIWPDVQAFRQTPKVRKAYERWRESYALSAGRAELNARWIQALRNL